MPDIADIGRRHLADQLTGQMRHCEVSEWLDEQGRPVKIYWKPLTGIEQKSIDAGQSEVERVCLTIKHRARDADGKLLFAPVPIESLMHDYDYSVLRAIAYIIASDMTLDDEQQQEQAEKE